MAVRVSALAGGRLMAPGIVAGIDEPGVNPGVVPDEVGLGEAGRVAEAVRLARRLPTILNSAGPCRRGSDGWWCGRSRMLLEQRRSVRRLGSGQRHLRAGRRERPATRRKILLPIAHVVAQLRHALTVGGHRL